MGRRIRRGAACAALVAVLSLGAATCGVAGETGRQAPLAIQDQGSFAVGGTVLTSPGTFDPMGPMTGGGQTFHGDHATVFYEIPADARTLPLVMWHGATQSSRSWGTTPDGREGFQTIFLRRRFPVHLVDQPRRGEAGRSTIAAAIAPKPDEQAWFDVFRIGRWPSYYPDVRFSRDPEALNQFFRSMTPDTGLYDAGLFSDAVSRLFDRIGPGILVTHSQSGGPGWLTAMKNSNVRGVVSLEPGSGFVFPEGEVPETMPSATGPLAPVAVPMAEFLRLTKIPIAVFYGDNIPEQPTAEPGPDNWRVRLAMARLWRDAVNRHGGDVTLVHLPDIGIRGNTHFLMSDTNNVEIADQISAFLAGKGLDR